MRRRLEDGPCLAAARALKVELRCASLPFVGLVADHYWFVVFDEAAGECRRWEVWQSRDAGGTSFGHLHRDLKPADAGVGGGPARTMCEWRGDEAVRISKVLFSCTTAYPYRDRYRAWPGPNSNTFVAWVLREAGIAFRLPWRAIGKRYLKKAPREPA